MMDLCMVPDVETPWRRAFEDVHFSTGVSTYLIVYILFCFKLFSSFQKREA